MKTNFYSKNAFFFYFCNVRLGYENIKNFCKNKKNLSFLLTFFVFPIIFCKNCFPIG